jgi:hypothetical protein
MTAGPGLVDGSYHVADQRDPVVGAKGDALGGRRIGGEQEGAEKPRHRRPSA